MTSPSPTPSRCRTWLSDLLRRFFKLAKFLGLLLLVIWGALAIRFSNLPWPELRYSLAILFFGFGIWMLWISRWKWRYATFAAVYVVLLLWWASIRPSQDRPWRPEVAVLPRASIEGDQVRIANVRDFTYRSADDFDLAYKEREVLLSHLTGVDFYISYWMPGPVGHTFLSFTFDNAPPVSISIETRPEVGEGFDPIASLFKQFELIYVVGEERDLVRVRTDHRGEDVYLYHVRIGPEAARELFRVYLERINELADRPEFYHLLKNNCTLNIIRYANAAGRQGDFDFRHLLNGLIDRYLYAAGFLDTSMPFRELRRRSWINDKANAAEDTPDFPERIREQLPVPAP